MLAIRTRHPERLTAIVGFSGMFTIVLVGLLLGWSKEAIGTLGVLFCGFIAGFRAAMEHPDVPLDRWGRVLPPDRGDATRG